MKSESLLLSLFFIVAPLSVHAMEPVPAESLEPFFEEQFKAYPALDSRIGPKAQLRWKENSKARKYRTRLREEWDMAKEPNFAGHYLAIKGIGCGTGCQVVFVVDWNTGKISSPPEDHLFEVRKDSRLLILKPYPECSIYGPPLLYEFRGNSFREIAHAKCPPK